MSDYYRKCHRPAMETDPYAAMGSYQRFYQSAVYRGAVCPKDWMAFEVGMTSSVRLASTPQSTWSSAFCCKSGDKLDTVVWDLGYEAFFEPYRKEKHACVQTIISHNKILGVGDLATKLEFTKYVKANESAWTETRTVTEYPQTTYPDDQTTSISTWTNTITWYDWDREDITTTVYWPGGRAFYPAWSIEWTAEDNATLDPPWPTLTSDMLIPTWTPGMKIYPGSYDRKGEGTDRQSPTPQTKLGKIGAPIVGTLAGVIGVLLMLGVVLWCLRRRRARKREIRRQNFLQELDVRSGEDGPARRSGSLTLNPEDRRE